MIPFSHKIPSGKKVFFASDFHLGVPTRAESLVREKKIVRWLDSIKEEAHIIFLVGDIFDFWYEYKKAIPKGFIRIQGKLAELRDKGIEIIFFSGNHDMWMFDYFTKELGIPVLHKAIDIEINGKSFMVGHGDGLGPGDSTYKILKFFFRNRLCQWLFGLIHPDAGITFALFWSRNSRIVQNKKEKGFLREKEFLYSFCKEQELKKHRDYYIFGHRHLPLNIEIGNNSRYINLGEWVNHDTFAEFDGNELKLKKFEDKQ
jgi:UDP-2,3-diacylglucosamine hydrolase